jgi:hypothetical protein
MINEHLKEEKLETLSKDQEVDTLENFYESPYGIFNIGICMQIDCDHVDDDCDPNTDDGWCDNCESESVAAIVFLL